MTTIHSDRTRTPRRDRQRGQALVEFSLAVIPFLLILMGIVDLGRAIYQMNGTAEAAREIAREASVVGTTSTAIDDIAELHRKTIPGLTFTKATDLTCRKVDDTESTQCRPGEFVRVVTRSTFTPATPIVMLFGSHTFESVTQVEIEQ